MTRQIQQLNGLDLTDLSIQISDRVQEVWQRGDSNDIEIKSRGADYLNRNMDSWFVGFFHQGIVI